MDRIALLGSHQNQLTSWLSSHPEGHERGAIIFFRRLGRKVVGLPHSERFVSFDIELMDDDWILDSSEVHLRINMRKLPEMYFRCETENLVLGFVHSHPSGVLHFSRKDDINEENLIHGLAGCNGIHSILVSIIYCDGTWRGRIRTGKEPNEAKPVRHISVLSDKLELHHITESKDSPESLLRQEAAFGKPFNAKMGSLRAAVVGLGGTGSPVATMLARCGIGELVLIDGDDFEETNMNRVRGYKSSDVGHKKAESLKKFIDDLGLGIKVIAFPEFVGDSGEAIDSLSSADVVFGCTDDVAGRDLLNHCIYYYGLILIDSGLTGFIQEGEDGTPHLRDHRGRVSCILPEIGACLRCQGIVTDMKLKYEQAIKDRPELADLYPETLKREHYLIGGGNSAPGVGPFTSMTADNALATFMNLIKPYRRLPSDLRQDNIWVDFVHMSIHSNEPAENPDCIYCRKKFLTLKEENYRLDMAKLGKISNV
ncbi:HesA/MoeB/ThiF family protein [Salinimicrobium xinjiangense]|uniref:HesA/MoeB/ThiF family protein n=1 Tax=Salinimicrobium xinjiangense TaxID=438596 RepID=UPI001B7F9B6C|nr:ThiF family adenylyltransferase [Salinimicrobium xinjiangense]